MTVAQIFFFPRGKCANFFMATELPREFGTRTIGASGKVNLVEVLERGVVEVVGRFRRERGIDEVIPDSKNIVNTLLIPRGASGGASDGAIVKVQVTEYPTLRAQAVGRVIEVLGDDRTPGIEIDSVLFTYGIPNEWPQAVEAEAQSLGDAESISRRGRVDLTSLPLVTIDGEDARDFDDAVYCEPLDKGGWRLLVAIADVSHYVAVGSALDQEAQHRGTSVYFPDRVVPMLPEVLSNDLCSLRPDVERFCVVCEMRVGARGKVHSSTFFNAVMRSASRLTYRQAQAILDGHRKKVPTRIADAVCNLQDVYRAFAAARRRRGAIDFDLPNHRFVCNPRGHIEKISVEPRKTSHRLIEECMIAANVEAARFLRKHRIPGLYRVHEPPEGDRLEELKVFLRSFGLTLSGRQGIKPTDINEVLRRVAGKPEEELVETVVLRSMKQALYQPANIGHFGLALGAYSHFTSPIRRYPDLLVHRAIKWMLKHGSASRFPYKAKEMQRLGEQCSRFERRAEDAVRDVEERLRCEYMSHRVGETYHALVSGVAPFGLFVKIPELGIDGLVHVTNLPHDYYHFGATGHSLEGEHYGRRYRLMDRLDVRVAGVDLVERKIDFHLTDEPVDSRPSRGRRKRRRRRP